MVDNCIKELAKADFYHGLLPREDMGEMLREAGDWLLRMTEPTEPGKRQFVVSVQTGTERSMIKHYIISRRGDKYALQGDTTFDTILDLIKHYLETGKPVQQDYVLKKPITRRKWELSHDDIEITKKLGEGAFGEVSKGILTRRSKSGKERKIDVAIKQAKLDNMTKEQIKEVMREARLMRYFDHVNIVRMFGVAAAQEPLMIVMELASDGALDSYLSKNENLPQEKLIEMTFQAASGLEHLHASNCIHRDIASRNCLYGKGQVKISDFGMSRIGDFYQMNPKNKVPIRWLAPETLRTAQYTPMTDVWSFGILTWEIFNKGQEPYPGLNNLEVIMFVKEGKHLTLGEKCANTEFSKVIEQHCFEVDAKLRWPMSLLVREIGRFVEMKEYDADKTKEPGALPTLKSARRTDAGSKSVKRRKTRQVGALGTTAGADATDPSKIMPTSKSGATSTVCDVTVTDLSKVVPLSKCSSTYETNEASKKTAKTKATSNKSNDSNSKNDTKNNKAQPKDGSVKSVKRRKTRQVGALGTTAGADATDPSKIMPTSKSGATSTVCDVTVTDLSKVVPLSKCSSTYETNDGSKKAKSSSNRSDDSKSKYDTKNSKSSSNTSNDSNSKNNKSVYGSNYPKNQKPKKDSSNMV